MGRHPQPHIKDGLLNACIDHALAHGLPERLEPLATATGTSARMLIYHFGTRDALLRAILGRARQRHLDTWGDLLRARPDEPYTVTLARAWTSMSGSDGRQYLQMFSQWRATPTQHLWPDFRRSATTDWLGPLEDGLRSIGRPELATLALAVIRGLLMDRDATADATRTDRAFQDFLTAVEHTTRSNHDHVRPARSSALRRFGERVNKSRRRGGLMEPNWLNAREDRAWRAFMHAHHQLVVHLNRGLQESGLSGADYEVLAVLSALDGDRTPARDLGNALGWEKSRLSQQVRRMQKDGLINREPNPDDARSTMVCLLPTGRATIEKAAPRHVADVRRNFIDLLTPAELDMLAALNERILRHLAEDDDSPAEDEPS
jgi:DNA-binding MarR family transcriptional regulator